MNKKTSYKIILLTIMVAILFSSSVTALPDWLYKNSITGFIVSKLSLQITATSESECKSAGGEWCRYRTLGDVGSDKIVNNEYCNDPKIINQNCKCSSSLPTACITQPECEGASGAWCNVKEEIVGNKWEIVPLDGFYCSFPSDCPICSAKNPTRCKTKDSCQSSQGMWCEQITLYSTGNIKNKAVYSGICNSPSGVPEGYTCKCSNNGGLRYCTDQKQCETAGGNWCNEEPYFDENMKSTYGGFGEWTTKPVDGFYCESSCSMCTKEQTQYCKTQQQCESVKKEWCKLKYPIIDGKIIEEGSCVPSSSSCVKCGQYDSGGWLSACLTQNECEKTGAVWCDKYRIFDEKEKNFKTIQTNSFYCTETCPVCSKEKAYFCEAENECKSAGANWCKKLYGDPYCTEKECPKCSKEEPFNCNTENQCKSIGLDWCALYSGQQPFCTNNCPKCSAETPYYCETENKCSAAKSNWCQSTYTDSSGKEISNSYCSEFSCPICSKQEPWNCQTENNCKSAKNSWCQVKYQNLEGGTDTFYECSNKCIQCSKDNILSCTTKIDCESANGRWFENIQRDNNGNIVSAEFSCKPKSKPMICSKDTPQYCNNRGSCESSKNKWCPYQYFDSKGIVTFYEYCSKYC